MQAGLISRLYRLFPDPNTTFPEPFEGLVSGFYSLIAGKPIFRIADGSRVAVEDLRLIPDEPELQTALEMELLPIPCPRIPHQLMDGFKIAQVDLVSLDAAAVAEAYRCDEPVAWSPDEIEVESLQNHERIVSVVRFLVGERWDNWRMLPLALCDDGDLRTFPMETEQALFIATDRQKQIFDWFPNWFLDLDYCDATGIRLTAGCGCAVMSMQDLLENLDKVIIHEESGDSCWDPKGDESPNTPWLVKVITEILDEHARGGTADLVKLVEGASLIPGNDGNLHKPGTAKTPLLVNQTEHALAKLLSALGVSYFILDPQDPLTPFLTRFRDEIGRLWNLTPGDLIDSLGVQLESLSSNTDKWRSEHAIDRLMGFLSRPGLELTDSRKETLRKLPIWLDIVGGYDAIDEHSYLSGTISPPKFAKGIRLLDNGKQASLPMRNL